MTRGRQGDIVNFRAKTKMAILPARLLGGTCHPSRLASWSGPESTSGVSDPRPDYEHFHSNLNGIGYSRIRCLH
jgi:hypothetical protein